MHEGMDVTFVKLRKFQDHLKGVMPGLEIIRVPTLWLSAEIACARLLWHSSLRVPVALAIPSNPLLLWKSVNC
jgi:hypothetical protein